MKKKKLLIPVAIIAAILVLVVAGIGIMVAKGYGISIGRYLEAKNGTAMFVRDNSPIQMLNNTERELFDKLDIGDKVMVIHDGIEESYPGRTGVHAVFKLSEGNTGDIPQKVVNELIELGWLETEIEINYSGRHPSEVIPGGTPVDEVFDIAVSYANWAEVNELYAKALNTDKMMISSVRHLPIIRFDTLADLEQFKMDFGEILAMDYGYDEVPSFNDTVAKYDGGFFNENSLMLVYVEASSGSCRYGVDSVYCDGNSFCVYAKQTNNPKIHTDDMAGWYITVAVPDSMIADCTEFDAAFK